MSGGHGHDEVEGDIIVLHQERLLPTMIIAALFAIVALFGLSQAGATKFEAIMGKAAYDKVRADIPTIGKEIPMHNPKVKYKDQDGKQHGQTPETEGQQAPTGQH